jgi:uncharacterized protein
VLYKQVKMKEVFKQIIVERQDWVQKVSLVSRDLKIEKEANYVFTGLRRAGKSYLLYQLIQENWPHTSAEQFLIMNFEDERLLEVQAKDLQLILEAYQEMYEHQPIVFLDEIQNVEHWQKFARRLADDGYRVFVTGSNSEMLSSEIASTLGGRFINKEILPLSFSEYLSFHQVTFSSKSKYRQERFEIVRHYQEFLKFGGFPELKRIENKREYLSSVYQKLFYGDLIARYNISNANLLKLLVKKLAESVNNETSVNRIKNLIKSTGVSIGSNTLFEYLNHLESSYLIASISNFHSKFVERETSKKYYFLDNGILSLFLYDQDTKLLENQVYIELRRRNYEVYFLKRKTEVDFYVPEKNLLIQVSYSIEDPETFKREVKALSGAMKEMNIQESWIITYTGQDILEIDAGKIHVIPAWQWLLGL